MWSVLKLLLARLLDKPDALREMLSRVLESLEAAAEATATMLDNIACKVMGAILGDDELWDMFVAWYQSLLSDDDIPMATGDDLALRLETHSPTLHLAQRIADLTGLDFKSILDLLIQLAPIIIDWWKNRGQ